MSLISSIYGELTTEIIRIVTGRMFSEEQIKSITSHAAGKYLAEFFPESGEEVDARKRVEDAKNHISSASKIISDLQAELDTKTTNLDALLEDIEEKKKLAERYQQLASTNKEQFAALRQEMEDALRRQLIEESQKGKNIRRFVSFLIGLLTLIAGAALGAYFKEVIAWIGIGA
ncbi:MAG: hypothetical protein ACFHHU_12865 [Porticoccaceae bacterium]